VRFGIKHVLVAINDPATPQTFTELPSEIHGTLTTQWPADQHSYLSHPVITLVSWQTIPAIQLHTKSSRNALNIRQYMKHKCGENGFSAARRAAALHCETSVNAGELTAQAVSTKFTFIIKTVFMTYISKV